MNSVVGICDCEPNGTDDGGRRDRQRLNDGEGNAVSAMTRMLVAVSAASRWGLNW